MRETLEDLFMRAVTDPATGANQASRGIGQFRLQTTRPGARK